MKLPQLSLRDLFYLVLVAAMGLGWWVTLANREKWHERRLEILVYDVENHLRTIHGDSVVVQDYGQSLELTLPDGRPAHK